MKPNFEKIKTAFSSENFRKAFQDTLSGDVFLKEKVRAQMPVALLICGLFIIYIMCGYRAQKQQKQIADLNRQLEEAHFEYLTLQAQLVEHSRQSFVLRRLQENGSDVKVSNKPAIEID